MNSLPVQNNSLENPSFFPALGASIDLLTLPALGALALFAACYKSNFNPSFDEMKRNHKPLVVCLHGNGYNEIQWVFFRYLFGHKYNIVTWNLDGLLSNDPKRGLKEYTEINTRNLINLCNATERKEVILVGHSMGTLVNALTAENMRESNPEIKVRGVISISTPSPKHSLLHTMTNLTKRWFPSIFQAPVRYQDMRGDNSLVEVLRERISASPVAYKAITSDGDIIAGQGGELGEVAYKHHFLGHYSPMFSRTVCNEVDEIIGKLV